MSETSAQSTPTPDPEVWWRTQISDISPGVIRFRGYPIEELIPNTSFPAMIYLMLRGQLPTEAEERLLTMALVAAVDHGPQAPSIAAARMAITCGIGINSAVATGVNLLGDTHGGAGQQCMALMAEIDAADPAGERTEELVAERLAEYKANKKFVPGFGHRFHPKDPRRDPLLAAVQEEVDAGRLSGRFLRIGTQIEAALAKGKRPIPMNIDGATAIIYSELGFSSELGRGLFVLSRSVGILAHAWEERAAGLRIKGPLPPPMLARYDGEAPRTPPGATRRDLQD